MLYCSVNAAGASAWTAEAEGLSQDDVAQVLGIALSATSLTVDIEEAPTTM